MRCEIVEEKTPLRRPPQLVAFVGIKTNQMRRDEIKLALEFWQRPECIDARDDSRHFEKLGQFPKHWERIHVEPKHFVVERFADVEKITGAAADIEDTARRRVIELELARALHVDAHPLAQVEVFRRRIRRGGWIGILAANFLEALRIDRFDDRAGGHARGEASVAQKRAGVARDAIKRFAVDDFSDLLRETQAGSYTEGSSGVNDGQ